MAPKFTAAKVAVWIVSIFLAIAFIGIGGSKLAGVPAMRQLFDQIGWGQWFRYVTGGLEVLGGLLVLIPSRAFWGAALLVCVMAGAIVAHLTILHTPPTSPVVLLVLSGLVAWMRRPTHALATA